MTFREWCNEQDKQKYYPPEPKDHAYCPLCGAELSAETTLYKQGNDILGCEWCVDGIKAGDIWERLTE